MKVEKRTVPISTDFQSRFSERLLEQTTMQIGER